MPRRSGAHPPVTERDTGNETPSGDWMRAEAARLYAAERAGREEPLLSSRREVTLADAYHVQAHGVELRVADGARVVGRKVGLTSEAMRLQVGINEPDSGVLLDTMAVPNGGTVAVAALRTPQVEAEIAFRLGTDLSGSDLSEAEAVAAINEVHLALEVIDSRFGLEEITLADSVADNAGCARFVLGPGRRVDGMDLAGEELAVSAHGQVVARGRGSEILGHPARSLSWLARHLAATSSGLRAGDVVLAGAVHASIPLQWCGTRVEASSPLLGRVQLNVT